MAVLGAIGFLALSFTIVGGIAGGVLGKIFIFIIIKKKESFLEGILDKKFRKKLRINNKLLNLNFIILN